MTKSGFGEHLRREREMRGVSLDEICVATRISTRFLEALENEEWDRLPGGVFNRGFVRAVARFLGLDEEGFVAEYAMAKEESAAAPVWNSQPVQQKQNIPPLAWIAVAVVLFLAGAGWYGWHRHAVRRARQNATQQTGYATAAPPAPSPELPAGASSASANSPDLAPGVAPVNDAGAGAPSAVPGSGLQLKIEAGKATTLTIVSDGKQAFSGDIIAGQTRTFSAQASVSVFASDAGAVLLQLNGRTLAPIGPPGQPGKVTLTLRDVPATAGGAD